MIIGAGTVWYRFRDTATPVPETDVRGALAEPVGSDPGDPGIYEYTTTGFEEVDALSGARHDYPATTFMTIQTGECGPVVSWQPIVERRLEWSHCGVGLSISATFEYHEWFGIPDEEDEQCPEPRPVFEAAGPIVCVAGGTTETYDVEVIGSEPITVGDTTVDAVHIKRVSTVAGESAGETTADVWRLPGTPLILRLELSSSNATATAVGDVHYVEDVTLELLDLTPGG